MIPAQTIAQSVSLRTWHEPIIQYGLVLVEKFPMIYTLLILIFLDILGGFTIAFMAKQANSSASFRGMCKKAYIVLIVGMCKAIEPYTYGLPMANIVALYFCAVECLSILENAALLGIPLPPVLVETLTKLRDSTKNQLWQQRIQANSTILEPHKKLSQCVEVKTEKEENKNDQANDQANDQTPK